MNTSEQNQLQDVDRISVRAGRRIRDTAGQLGETAARASEGLEESLDSLEVKLDDIRASVLGRTQEYSRTANNYVAKNPWVAVGISAGFAFLAGLLIGRRRGD